MSWFQTFRRNAFLAVALAAYTGKVHAQTNGAWAGLAGSSRIDDIAVYDSKLLLVIEGSQYRWYQRFEETASAPAPLAAIPGWPRGWASVDAAVEWDGTTILLFRGPEYIRYDVQTQTIAGSPVPLRNWPGWPLFWSSGLSAAAHWDDTTLVLFSGAQYAVYDLKTQQFTAGPLALDNFEGWPANWTTVDAAVNTGDGKLHLFRGGQAVTYDQRSRRVEPGGPRPFAGAPRPAGLQNLTRTSEPARASEPVAERRVSADPAVAASINPASVQPAPIVHDAATGGPATQPARTVSQSVLELDGSNGQGVTIAADKRLNAGTEGTLQISIAAEWDLSAIKADTPPVTFLKLGSNSRIGYGFFISADKTSVGMTSGQEQEEWGFDLSDGQLHQLTFVTSGDGTEAFGDGKSLGRLPISYAPMPESGLPLSIGRAPFVGRISQVRIWGGKLSEQQLLATSKMAARELAVSPEGRLLLGYLAEDAEPSAKTARFTVLTKPFNISGVWMRDGDQLGIRIGEPPNDFRFNPPRLIVIRSATPESPMAGRAGLSGVAGSGSALVMLDSKSELPPQLLKSTRPNEYVSVGGTPLQLLDEGRLKIGSVLFRRAERKTVQAAKLGDSFEKARMPFQVEFTEMGYDIRRLSPWDMREGAVRRVFEHVKLDSNDFDTKDQLNVLRGLHLVGEYRSEGMVGGKSYTNSKEYYDAMRFGIGVNAEAGVSVKAVSVDAGFSLNTKFRRALTTMYTEEKIHRFSGKVCRKYALLLDRANATVHGEFRQAVEQLKVTGDYDGLIASFGTHYPHAVTYGGKSLRDSAISRTQYASAVEDGLDIEAAIHAGVNVADIVKVKGGLSGSYGRDTKTGMSGGATQEDENDISIGSADGSSCLQSDPVPIHLDLRPIDELLAPPFFDDPEIIGNIRLRLKARLEETLATASAQLLAQLRTQIVFDPEQVKRQVNARKKAEQLVMAKPPQGRTCPAKMFRVQSEHSWAEFRMPEGQIGQAVLIPEGVYNKYVFPKCNRVWWENLTFTCSADGNWEKTNGNWDADALCHGSTPQHQFLATGER